MLAILISLMVGLTGLVCIGLGISMKRGNISLLHDYHRSRVKPEDAPALGKAAGGGMMLVGISILVYAVSMAAVVLLDVQWLLWAGLCVFTAGLALGILRITRALNRYNNGIF